MIDPADALAGRLFATPDGALWLASIEHRFPYLHAEIAQRIARMRAFWRTGAPEDHPMPESRQERAQDASPEPVDPDAEAEDGAEEAAAEAEDKTRGDQR